ncbi:MAG: heme o synthase [Crocinitomicaceae bacterium]|nr:heme o synthase [Crocinitomicaceae bacterium]
MISSKAHKEERVNLATKIKDYSLLIKFRLSFSVVISAFTAYLLAGGESMTNLFLLSIGGMMITGASNAFNQIYERELDKLMSRTQDRPLARGAMKVAEALIVALLLTVVGCLMLFKINYLVGILGVFSMFMYVFMYTPLKRITAWSVFVGAFPGAIPPMIGVVAVTGHFNMMAGILFLIQFIWQFPHFWALAWMLHEDYQKAGFSLLPSRKGKDRVSAFLILAYSLIMIPVILLPWAFEWTGMISLITGAILGMLFYLVAYQFYRNPSDQLAKKLMLASVILLPVMQIIYVIDKV